MPGERRVEEQKGQIHKGHHVTMKGRMEITKGEFKERRFDEQKLKYCGRYRPASNI